MSDATIIVERAKLLLILNCAEADLIGALGERNLCSQDGDPMAETVRDLHAYIKSIDPEHSCSVDVDLASIQGE